MRVILFCLILLKTLSCNQPLAPYTIVTAGGTNYCFNRADFIKVRNNLDAISGYKSNISFLEIKAEKLSNRIADMELSYKDEKKEQEKAIFKSFFRGAGAGAAAVATVVVAILIRSLFN